MGILGKSCSITQFSVTGLEGKSVPEIIQLVGQGLEDNRFVSIDEGADEVSTGWVHLQDHDNADFSNINVWQRDNYLCFAMRRDERKVNGRVLRRESDKLCTEYLEKNPGMKFVPKQMREELRDAARKNLLAKTYPVPSMIDIVWDLDTNRLYMASLATKAVDRLTTLFHTSFPTLRLAMFHPFAKAQDILPESLHDTLNRMNQAGSPDTMSQIKDNVWIGQDFFLWLIYQTLEGRSKMEMSCDGPDLSGTPFDFFVDKRVSLTGPGDDGVQRVIVSGPQNHYVEIRSALRQGKQVQDGTIIFVQDDEEWKVTLKGEKFLLGSLKTPNICLDTEIDDEDPESENQAIFYEKMALISKFEQMFDSLFRAFLEIRLSHQWGEVETDMTAVLEQAA